MTWNYRLVYHDDEPEERQWIGLHEVYYEGLADDSIFAWTAEPVTFNCDTDEGADGVIKSLDYALKSVRNTPMLMVTTLVKQIEQKNYKVSTQYDELDY